MHRRTPLAAVTVYLGAVVLIMVPLTIVTTGADPAVQQFLIGPVMFAPAVAAVIARILTGQHFQIGRPTILTLLLAFVPTLVMTLLYVAATVSLLTFTSLTESPVAWLIAVVNAAVAAFGEEAGWRGYLLPNLRRMTDYRAANALVAVIWFAYHVPIILLTSAYGNAEIPVWANLLLFAVLVCGISFYVGAVWERGRNVWAPTLLHGVWNHTIQGTLAAAFIAGSPWLMGEFGLLGAATGVILLVIALLMTRGRYGTPLGDTAAA
jgi:membrane protease YdiL (CAAX protease family)